MRASVLVAALSCSGAALLFADPDPALLNAARPLVDGVPEVAVTRLTTLLADTPPEKAEAVREKLAEAQLAALRPTEALQTLGEANTPDARFLRGQALEEMGQPSDALELYLELLRQQPAKTDVAFAAARVLRSLGRNEEALARFRALARDARLGVPARLEEAELLLNLGQATEARRALDAVTPKLTAHKKEKRLLRARLDLAAHRPEKAVSALQGLLKKPDDVSHEVMISALFAMADAHLQLGTPEAGDDSLEDFIDRHPQDQTLPEVFAKLAQLYRAERKPPRAELERWLADDAQPRRGLAQWYLAQFDLAAGRRESAQRHFQELIPHPALAPAFLQYARLLIAEGRADDAVARIEDFEKLNLPPETRQLFQFEKGRAEFARANFSKSAALFEPIARSLPGAKYNAALGWLQQDDNGRGEQKANVSGSTSGDLLLEEALQHAKKNDPAAMAELQAFLAQDPQNPRVAEAHLALAELAYHSTPPRFREAENSLAAARNSAPSEAVQERADYLELWLADAQNAAPDRVITAANNFLRAHPSSTFAGDVRLKLGEIHFRRQDFANAQTQFEALAQQDPGSSLAEKALFLAAQSAAFTMTPHALDHALDLLAQVIKREGEFRWAARLEQAAVARRLGKLHDAQLLYDEVLKGDARSSEKREALCGKADVLAEEAGQDPANLTLAISTYDQLAAEAANQPHWRNQALFKKAVCQEKQSQPEAALATFYRVLDFDSRPDRAPEFFWFYKAGFDAARLLEAQEKWQSAASIYDRLAGTGGPRSEEAKARLAQLRLEHFLW